MFASWVPPLLRHSDEERCALISRQPGQIHDIQKHSQDSLQAEIREHYVGNNAIALLKKLRDKLIVICTRNLGYETCLRKFHWFITGGGIQHAIESLTCRICT